MNQKQMSLEDGAIKKYVQILINMGCKVAVLAPNGDLYGNAELKNYSEKTHKIREFSWGSILNHARPFIEDLQAGQSVMIPLNEFPMKSMSSTVTSYCVRKWGQESYTTRQHENALQVLRLL
jgi:hypothetical protein